MELVVINLNEDASDLVRFIVILIFLQASQGDKSWLTVGMIKRCEKNSVFIFRSQSYVVLCRTTCSMSNQFKCLNRNRMSAVYAGSHLIFTGSKLILMTWVVVVNRQIGRYFLDQGHDCAFKFQRAKAQMTSFIFFFTILSEPSFLQLQRNGLTTLNKAKKGHKLSCGLWVYIAHSSLQISF